MKLDMDVGLSPGDMLDGDPAPPPQKKGHSTQFSAHICCGQMVGWIKMPLGREVGLSPSDIMLDGGLAPPHQKKGQTPSPQFSAHFYCGQTAGWIEMPFGMEVGLSPGHILLDEDPAPPHPVKKEHSPPNFRPCLLSPNSGMDQDATWYKGRYKGPHLTQCCQATFC